MQNPSKPPSEDQAKQEGQPAEGPQASTQHIHLGVAVRQGDAKKSANLSPETVPEMGEWWSLLQRRAKGTAEASDGEG